MCGGNEVLWTFLGETMPRSNRDILAASYLSPPYSSHPSKGIRNSPAALRVIYLATAALLNLPLASTFAQDSAETILVRRVVPANLHEELDVSKFKSIVAKSLPLAVTVGRNDTLSGLISKKFRISQGWTPAAYAETLSHVMASNNIENPTSDLKIGQQISLPDLPVTAQIAKVKNNPELTNSRMSVLRQWGAQEKALISKNSTNLAPAGVEGSELQLREILISDLHLLSTPKSNTTLEKLRENSDYEVLQERMSVALAQTPDVVNSLSLLSTPEVNFLSSFLARQPTTKPLLVILDDGWPSQPDFLHAAKFVIDASREIRQKFGLQDTTHGDSKNLKELESQYMQGTQFCDQTCEYPNLKTHAAMIRKSLSEFTDIDTSSRVEVMYLPLNKAQLFSENILTEIVQVALLADSVVDGLVLNAPGVKPPPDKKRGAPGFASAESDAAKILRPTYLSNPQKIYSGTEMSTETDKGIIDSVVNFLWLYSMASQRPHFLSMSWTAPQLKYSPLFRPNGYGLWFAASGNNPSINVQSDAIQFAARSSDPGDVLAVENLSSACPSSKLTDDFEINVLGLAFPGRITSGLCGSSFSTPRVAWLLAAKEAIKGTKQLPYTPEWNTWTAKARGKLLALKNLQQSGESRYQVSLWQLLSEQPPK